MSDREKNGLRLVMTEAKQKDLDALLHGSDDDDETDEAGAPKTREQLIADKDALYAANRELRAKLTEAVEEQKQLGQLAYDQWQKERDELINRITRKDEIIRTAEALNKSLREALTRYER